MNIFEYLDRRNKRSYILKQIKYFRGEYNDLARIVNKIPESHKDAIARNGIEIKENIKYYTERLNALI